MNPAPFELPDIGELPPGEDELPYENDEPMESPRHRQQMSLLIQVLKWHFRDHPEVYVGGNMAIWFSTLQVRQGDFLAPDVMVVREADQRERKSWVVWDEEGRTPCVVVELLSKKTARMDRGRKMRLYDAGLKLHDYFLFDPATEKLEGHRAQRAGGWKGIRADRHGTLACESLSLRLGVREGEFEGVGGQWLRWIGPDGTVLPTEAEAQRAEAEAQRAEAEAQRAEAEAQRARADRVESERARLLEQLRALGVEPESAAPSADDRG